MIPALSAAQTTTNIKFVSQGTFHVTKTKIERVALFCFASLSFFIGYASFSVGTPIATLIAIACFIAGGAMLWVISRSKDYEDPKELQGYRKEASAGMPLDEIRKKHGWDNMIQYEIPPAKYFPPLFRSYVSSYTITALIRLYEELQEKIEKHDSPIQLPVPSEFSAKFFEETVDMSVCEVIEKYDVLKLYQYGIAPKELCEAAQDYSHFKIGWERTVKNVKQTFKSHLQTALSVFHEVLGTSKGSTPSQEGWIRKWKSEAAFLQDAEPEAWFSSPFEILQENSNDFEDESLQHILEAQVKFRSAVEHAKKTKTSSLALLEASLSKEKARVNSLFTR